MAQEIDIPGSDDPTLQPSNQTFYFKLANPCTVCFGPSNPPNAFPALSNQSFSNWGAQSPSYTIPANAVPSPWIQFNTSPLGTPCSPSGGIAAAPRIIHVGSSLKTAAGETVKKTKKKSAKKASKKSAKKAAKKSAKKSAKKAGKKAARKPAKKSAKKSRKAGKSRRR